MKTGKTLCLNMIVKNEMANLERCLGAVAPYVGCWVIGDTGSSDGTQEFIRSFFAARNIPGELHSFPFIDFAQARNEALDLARASRLTFDYLLLTDADMELTVQDPAFTQYLCEVAYKVLQRSGVTYWNTRLLRRDVQARYKGVTHEFLDVLSGNTMNLEGISFIDHGTGSNRADKYERDARLLTNAIATERELGMIARYTFYLANTLRDSGQKEAALKAYLDRASLGDWYQEVFISLLNAARLKEALQYSNDQVVGAYAEATNSCPTRAEALHGAARFCRNKAIYEQGYQFAAKGLAIAYPSEALFAEDWIYEYGLMDELAINAYWTERYAECVDACDKLLSEGRLPVEQRDRVLKNKELAVDKLRENTEPARSTLANVTATQQKPSTEIPRVFHFITGLDSSFGGKPFSFIHYMAIRSALRVNAGFRARVYFHYEPSGKYWDAVKGDVERVPVDLPTHVFGNPLKHFAHKADVLRMQILLENGGIYLDLDTICQRPFEPLLDGRVVMGLEEKQQGNGSRSVIGLCNATIIAPPNAEFLRLWYEAYRDFSGGMSGDAWNKFSVQVPMALARDHPELLRIEPAASFFWPCWDQEGIAAMFSRDANFPEAYSFHLWETQSWSIASKLDPHAVRTIDTTYNKIARQYLDIEEFVDVERPVAPVQEHFEEIYEHKVWGRGSGVGSRADTTLEYRNFLQQFMLHNHIRSIVDFGCGDWQFSRYIDWSQVTYVGVDVVPMIVEENQRKFGSDTINFQRFESIANLPRADLLLCKDVLQHLPNEIVKNYLAEFRKRYKFSLITNDDEPAHLLNVDIGIGGWRTLRLEQEPFCELGAVVCSWAVLWGSASTRKSTYLLYQDVRAASVGANVEIAANN